MVKLTDEQLQELDRVSDRKLTVVDPRSSMQYVLIPRAEYERQLADAEEEAELARFTDAAARRNFHDLDREEAEHGETW